MISRLISNFIVSFIPLAVLTGCSPTFMPIGDHKVFMNFYLPFGNDGGLALALLCTPDEGFCGRRKVNEDEYEPDQFLIQTAEDIADGSDGSMLSFAPAKDETSTMQAGGFALIEIAAKPGEAVRFQFNDSDYAEAIIPPALKIIEPPFFLEQSLASGSILHIAWESPKPEFPLHWEFVRLDNEPDEQPCDLLVWERLEGDAVDTGSLELPLDAVPKDLPVGGCEAAVILRRRSEGELPPGLPAGYVRGVSTAGVIVRILP